jgi:nucleoid-associated protein YgaU
MPIYSGSRYEDSLVDFFHINEYGQSYPIVFYTVDDLETVSFYTHIYTPGETLHGLSQRYYNRPDLWWTIAEYNPELTDFFSIPAGTVIRIPSV